MKKSNILFIDDEIVLASKIKQILELEEYIVHYESSAITALEYLKNHVPNLIICDIMMPEMDGFEFYYEIQKTTLKAIPFVFLSANNNFANAAVKINLCAEDCLTKPISRKDLLNAIVVKLKK